MTDGPRAIICSRRHGCVSVNLDPGLAADIASSAREAGPIPGPRFPPPRVPRTEPSPEQEAQRHAHEVEYWARQLDEFASFLPGIRRRRGDDRAGRLVRDVIEEIKAAQGQDAAVLARDRLGDVWRGAGQERRRP